MQARRIMTITLLVVVFTTISAGQPVQVGSEFQVNTYNTSSSQFPSVAMDAEGNFIVGWLSNEAGVGPLGTFSVQRFDSIGNRQGSEFQVSFSTTSIESENSVAMDANGNFVVVWRRSDGMSGAESLGIFGQRFDSIGNRQGSEFQVNTYNTSSSQFPSVAMDAEGNFIVGWLSNEAGVGPLGTFSVQRFDSIGNRQGSEFQVSFSTTSTESENSVAIDANGNFVVVWRRSDGVMGVESLGIFGQRFSFSLPAKTVPALPGFWD